MEKKKILIFDDNVQILELCKEILEDLGCEIKTSTSTNNVLEKVRNYLPHLIFMDNWLPDISGIEATRLIKSESDLQHIPVIYFTANTDIRKLAEEAGADDYIAKPFDIDLFEEKVKKYLELS